jgi:nitrite reductase (NO-forming)
MIRAHISHTRAVAVSVGVAAMLAVVPIMAVQSGRQAGSPAAASSLSSPLEVTVTATEFSFSPSTLTVPAGRVVQLTFLDKGQSIHNWTVQGLSATGVKLLSAPKDLGASFASEMARSVAQGIPFAVANPGERTVVQFTPTTVGVFKTLCTLPGHAQMGMVAKLQVIATGAKLPVPAAAAPNAAAAPPLPLPAVAPPVGRRGPKLVHVTLVAKEVEATIDDGVRMKLWTFNGTVPGPMIRVRVGDTVEITLKNAANSMMSHSVDLHAVTGPGGGSAATDVAPGQTKSFMFKALIPGVFVYHCATAPVAEHLASGMYGMIVVEPAGGLPRVDKEFYVMQGELYLQGSRTQQGERQFSMDNLLAENPSYIIFNGSVGSLMGAHMLQARVGQTVRIFFGDAGPDLTSSFHMIGTIFSRVTLEGSMTDWEHNIAVTEVPAGGATIVEFTPRVPGIYMMLDHSISRTLKGGLGALNVIGKPNPAIFMAMNGMSMSMKH